MTDAIDLQATGIIQSPDVASWAKTVRITRIACTPVGGFVIEFDRQIPDAWKWPSAPPPSTDNFQYTVWIFKQLGGLWYGAGFVQMWQRRPMGTGALPPIFAPNPDTGAPGYTNWWGDVRKLWPPLSDYVPKPEDQIAFMVSAGNGRMTGGITSVAERSNVVLYTIHASDAGNVIYLDPPLDPPDPPDDPPVDPPAPAPDAILARLDALEAANAARHQTVMLTLQILQGRQYVGSAKVPYLGTAPITLAPK